MAKTMGKSGWSCATLALIGVATSCSASGRDDMTSIRPALTTANGMAQNGLTTNGLIENGMWANGMWANGMWANGMWANGMWANGMWANGMWANGMWANGMWANGMWANGLTGDAAVPGDTLRSSAYARQLLQYIYSCAMPATTYDTTLDPNEAAPLLCASDADCDIGYACSGTKCVIPLQGGGANGSGLGVNADGKTWWGDGVCDETCQRWVSACVLARTNAYGVRVQISMRAPSNAPDAIKDALEVDATERSDYGLREGAFYGNIFATTPTTPPPPPIAPAMTYSGEATGPIAATPTYYACAGPGSNIPQLTKRFCSSQGDQVVIKVPGVCLGTSSQPPVCEGEDTDGNSATFGAIQDCHTQSSLGGPAYKEVITVYLRQPIAVCGDSVCESSEDSGSCPTDCHPGTWALNFVANLLGGVAGLKLEYFGPTMLGPDDSIVVSGTLSDDIDLGGGILPATQGRGFLVKFHPDGTYAWGTRFGGTGLEWIGNGGLRVSPNGDITIGGIASRTVSGTDYRGVAISKFSAEGIALQSTSLAITGSPSNFFPYILNLALDSQGNTIVEGAYRETITIGSSSFANTDWASTYLAKVSPAGTLLWAQNFVAAPGGLAVDPDDNILVATTAGASARTYGTGALRKLAPDGSPLWTKAAGSTVWLEDANVDSDGNVYVVGGLAAGHAFGTGAIADLLGDTAFLAKYGPDASLLWVSYPKISCPWGAPSCAAEVLPSYRTLSGAKVAFDRAGTPVLASFGNPVVGGAIDFGVGAFSLFGAVQTFLSAYSPSDGTIQWAKTLPSAVYAAPVGLAIDSRGHVVVQGGYAGSMEADDRLLVTPLPEDDNVMNGFLASFAMPSLIDKTPPVVGAGTDSGGNPLLSVPLPIFVQATSAQGAQVFFVPPTAIDAASAGVSVACVPPPNTTLPIGQTTVTCTASDPVGNHSSASFAVTVVDTMGPVFSPTADLTVEATSASGASVTYAVPAATDQVSGPASVGCDGPPSGTLFPIGKTTISCTATDALGNQGHVTFAVDVRAPGACSLQTEGRKPEHHQPRREGRGHKVIQNAAGHDQMLQRRN